VASDTAPRGDGAILPLSDSGKSSTHTKENNSPQLPLPLVITTDAELECSFYFFDTLARRSFPP
jgi:hypothetical protein